jgi:hypothetical protein
MADPVDTHAGPAIRRWRQRRKCANVVKLRTRGEPQIGIFMRSEAGAHQAANADQARQSSNLIAPYTGNHHRAAILILSGRRFLPTGADRWTCHRTGTRASSVATH